MLRSAGISTEEQSIGGARRHHAKFGVFRDLRDGEARRWPLKSLLRPETTDRLLVVRAARCSRVGLFKSSGEPRVVGRECREFNANPTYLRNGLSSGPCRCLVESLMVGCARLDSLPIRGIRDPAALQLCTVREPMVWGRQDASTITGGVGAQESQRFQ